jgi:hypothetical protein
MQCLAAIRCKLQLSLARFFRCALMRIPRFLARAENAGKVKGARVAVSAHNCAQCLTGGPAAP